jgi:hypothetical protein
VVFRLARIDGLRSDLRLKVLRGRWDDPFAEPHSPENRAWVEEHGKCVRVDCAAEAPYADFIGRQVTEVRPLLEDEFGSVAGLRLSVAQRSLWFVVRADEDDVFWTPPESFTEPN